MKRNPVHLLCTSILALAPFAVASAGTTSNSGGVFAVGAYSDPGASAVTWDSLASRANGAFLFSAPNTGLTVIGGSASALGGSPTFPPTGGFFMGGGGGGGGGGFGGFAGVLGA